MSSPFRPWVKWWPGRWLADPDIQRLPHPKKGRWIDLFSLVSAHGEGGVWHVPKGVAKLPGSMRQGLTSEALLRLLRSLPGIEIRDDAPPSHGITIIFINWPKHQGDSSAARTRKYRERLRVSDAASPSPQNLAGDERREDIDKNPLPPSRSRRRSSPRSIAATLSADPPPRDPAVVPPAEVTALEQAIAYDHPAWSARQVEDEARRRLNGAASPTPDQPTPASDTQRIPPPALRFRDA